MAFPPINIYTQNCDPDGTMSKILDHLPDAKVTRHPDGSWHEITGAWKRGLFKTKLTLKATHDPDYYAGEDWQNQVSGMKGYFGGFPGAAQRPDLFSYLSGLSFSFNFMLDPDPVEDDPRLKLAFMLAQYVDGVIFLPGRLLDSSGNVILDGEGNHDPEAVVPEHQVADQEERVKAIVTEAELNQDDDPYDPPSQKRLVDRLLVTAALVERAFLEAPEVEDAELKRKNNLESLRSADALGEAEKEEAEALQAPVGKLKKNLGWSLPWLSEGGMMIAWTLGLCELPPYDEQVDVQELYEIAEGLRLGELEPAPRPLAELQKLAAELKAIHWRIRQFYLKKEAMDFETFAPTAWWGALDLGQARLINRDLEIQGKPISECTEEEWKPVSGIMEERRQALHWALGHNPVYSKTDTST